MGCNQCPDPVKVEVLDDYLVRVTFADGKITITDMKPDIERGSAFKKMKNKYFFSLASIGPGDCIMWPGELDFAPEHFYYDGVSQ